MTDQDITMVIIAAGYLLIGFVVGRLSKDWKRL